MPFAASYSAPNSSSRISFFRPTLKRPHIMNLGYPASAILTEPEAERCGAIREDVQDGERNQMQKACCRPTGPSENRTDNANPGSDTTGRIQRHRVRD